MGLNKVIGTTVESEFVYDSGWVETSGLNVLTEDIIYTNNTGKLLMARFETMLTAGSWEAYSFFFDVTKGTSSTSVTMYYTLRHPYSSTDVVYYQNQTPSINRLQFAMADTSISNLWAIVPAGAVIKTYRSTTFTPSMTMSYNMKIKEFDIKEYSTPIWEM